MQWVHQTHEHWLNNKNMNTTQGLNHAGEHDQVLHKLVEFMQLEYCH